MKFSDGWEFVLFWTELLRGSPEIIPWTSSGGLKFGKENWKQELEDQIVTPNANLRNQLQNSFLLIVICEVYSKRIQKALKAELGNNISLLLTFH